MSTKMRPSLKDLRELGNWSYSFRWGVIFNDMPNALANKPDPQEINFRAESMSIPEKEVETVEVQIRGHKKRQPGIGTYTSPITLVLVETVKPVVQTFIRDWAEICWATDGTTGTTEDNSDVECSITLYLLDNKDEPYMEYTLYGCQYTSASKGDVDGSNQEPIKPSISIAYDYFTCKTL